MPSCFVSTKAVTTVTYPSFESEFNFPQDLFIRLIDWYELAKLNKLFMGKDFELKEVKEKDGIISFVIEQPKEQFVTQGQTEYVLRHGIHDYLTKNSPLNGQKLLTNVRTTAHCLDIMLPEWYLYVDMPNTDFIGKSLFVNLTNLLQNYPDRIRAHNVITSWTNYSTLEVVAALNGTLQPSNSMTLNRLWFGAIQIRYFNHILKSQNGSEEK